MYPAVKALGCAFGVWLLEHGFTFSKIIYVLLCSLLRISVPLISVASVMYSRFRFALDSYRGPFLHVKVMTVSGRSAGVKANVTKLHTRGLAPMYMHDLWTGMYEIRALSKLKPTL
jgi:hypothetical protein